MFGELRLINPRIFPLAALLFTALNPLSAQVSITGGVSPLPPLPPITTWDVGGICTLVMGSSTDR
jgi:hypothetical protein